MPSRLEMVKTFESELRRGAPFAPSGTTVGASADTTLLTPGTRSIAAFNEAAGPPLEPAVYTAIVKTDGLVLARNVGYEDCVRRPAATDAMATPPIDPMRRTTLR
jgi:hypothetical protein